MSHRDGVLRLLDAANRLHDARARWAGDLARTTGLSGAGVLFGFDHLEREIHEEDLASLDAWAGSQPEVERVTVVLSATVFTAALRAIVLARLVAPEVVVRPSRREPVFARALVELIGDPSVTIDEGLDVAAVERGMIHAYGADETLLGVERAATVPVLGHGTGMGIAIVSGDLEAAATGLADDVIAFDQRGCLSPRIVWVEGTDRARAFAAALAARLDGSPIARGEVHADERAAARMYVESMRFAGEVVAGDSCVVGVGAVPVVPPPGRHVHVAPFETAAELRAGVSHIERFVTTAAVDSPRWADVVPAHARVARPGHTQRPRLDGPVDRREPRAVR